MASDPSSLEYNDLKFVEYLGNVGILEKENALRNFLDKHNELSSREPVSPRVFQELVDHHFEPVNEARTYITEELSTAWGIYAILSEDQGQEDKEGLKLMGDSGAAAKGKYNDLFKRLIDIIIETAPRVDWKTSKKHQQETAEWVDEKHSHFDDLVNDGNNSLIRKELETVRDALAQAKMELPVVPETLIKAMKGLTKTGGKKRPNDDGGSGPAAKKSKSSAQWWGPHKSKLNCSDAFLDVIREYKAYIANPPDQPGTREYRLQMTRFLRKALDDVGLRDKLNDVLLMKEFQFRSPGYQPGDSTALVVPGLPERNMRLGIGRTGWHAFNDFKKIMGGGFSPDELLNKNMEPPVATVKGMVALAHSQAERNEVRLRGGGSSGNSKLADYYLNTFPFNEVDTLAKRQIDIREGMAHRFRDPTVLWNELLEDAELPKGTWLQRIHANRPPMIDPNRVGTKTASAFKDVINKIPVPSEWEQVTEDDDEGNLDGYAAMFEKIVEDARGKVYNFVYENDDTIDQSAPTLLQPGGKDKPKTRFAKKLSDKNFAKPIGYAFRARTYQVLRFYLAWRYFLMDNNTLSELLEQEKKLYEVWLEHEDLYMNWENNKWFELSDPLEIRSLENRYQSRELLCMYWRREIAKIDEAFENMKNNQSYYLDPVKNQKEGRVIPAEEPLDYTTPPGVAEILAFLDDPISKASKGNKTKTPTKVPPTFQVFAKLDTTPYDGTNGFAAWEGIKSQLFEPQSLNKTGDDVMDVDEDDKEEEDEDEGEDEGEDEDEDEGAGDNANDGMDVDGELEVDPWTNPGGLVNVDTTANAPSPIKDTSAALQYLKNTREVYEKERDEIVRKNDKLDPLDPGNRAPIHRNNIDIMAKSQVIWSLDTEIYNLNRAIDPFAEKSHGLGAKHTWQLPPEDAYYKFTKQIPKKPDVPLGIKSIGRGPLPGEHPQPGHPRVFIGACAGFGKDPGFEGTEEPAEWEGGALFGPKPPGGSGGDTGGNSGGAAKTGKSAGGENNANPSGNTTADMGNSKTDAVVGGASHAVVDTTTGNNVATTPGQAVLDQLRGYLRKKNAAEVTIRQMTRIKNRGKSLNGAQQKALEAAKKAKKDNLALFKKVKSGVDAQTQTRADLLEQEERDKMLAQVKLADEAAEKSEKNQYEAAQVAASVQGQIQAEKEKQKQIAAEEAARKTRVKAAAAAKLQQLQLQQEQQQQQATVKSPLKTPVAPLKTPQAPTDVPQLEILKRAEEVTAIASLEFKKAREMFEDAMNKTAKAREAAKADKSNPELQKQLAKAKEEENNAIRYVVEWVSYYRIAKESRAAQMAWDEEPESTIELQDRLETLQEDWQEWASGFNWKDNQDDLRWMNDFWILTSVVLIFSALKAVGMNPGVSWWWEINEAFWKIRAKTLERKRQIWIFGLVRQLNHTLSQLDPPVEPFLKTPPHPPLEWDEPTPSKEELLQQERTRLGIPLQNRFMKISKEAEEQQEQEQELLQVPQKPVQLATPPPNFTTPSPRVKKAAPSPPPNKMLTPDPTPAKPALPAMTVYQTPQTPLPSPPKAPKPAQKKQPAPSSPTPASKQKLPPKLVLNKSPVNKATMNKAPTPMTNPTPTPIPAKLSKDWDLPPLPHFKKALPHTLPPKPVPSTTPKTAVPSKTPKTSVPLKTPKTSVPVKTPKTSVPLKTPKTSLPANDLPPLPHFKKAPPPKNPVPTTTPKTAVPPKTSVPVKTPKTSVPPKSAKKIETPKTSKSVPATATKTKSAAAPGSTPATAVVIGDEGRIDAWPEFKELLKATWSSIIAHEALKQKDGDTSGVPGPDRLLWPKPVLSNQSKFGGGYYCL